MLSAPCFDFGSFDIFFLVCSEYRGVLWTVVMRVMAGYAAVFLSGITDRRAATDAWSPFKGFAASGMVGCVHIEVQDAFLRLRQFSQHARIGPGSARVTGAGGDDCNRRDSRCPGSLTARYSQYVYR